MALKSKMQSLREELDKAHDQLEEKNREFEAEKEIRAGVALSLVLCRNIWPCKVHTGCQIKS